MSEIYTPAKVVESKLRFSIPIYQRLFEWDADNVETLLDDLYHSYTHTPSEPYYIGLLTDTAQNELVDGQQRFTVLTLIGIVCAQRFPQSGWKNFIEDVEPRLKFSSRPKDDAYLRQVIEKWDKEDDGGYVNCKMKSVLEVISKYLEEVKDPNGFSDYIFNNASFFISSLPEGYSPSHLNKYFERMNSAGKNLEQHEILKVKLLKNLPGDVTVFMRLWNKISEMETPILKKRTHRNEDEESLMIRRNRVLQCSIETIFNEGLVNGLNNQDADTKETRRSLKDIPMSSVVPKERKERTRDSDSVISFPMMLLLALYWTVKGKRDEPTPQIIIKEFFNTGNLLDTFAKYIPYEGSAVSVDNIRNFIHQLLRVRVILDYCFIRTADYGYTLEMVSSKASETSRLLMLESMLFVASSKYTYYRWFSWLMQATNDATYIPEEGELFRALKAADDTENPWDTHPSLFYPNDIRYWFWRLDFYLWDNRKTIFANFPNALAVADNYRFVRNRSIEHVAPQHPIAESSLQWEDSDADRAIMNSFGNLVMISNGLNSALKNQPYEIKKAHVQAYIQGSINGSIESLSLLLLNSLYNTWDKKVIENYGQLSECFLIDSYQPKSDQKPSSIIENWESIKPTKE